jgi:glycogen phosphorylase
VREKCVFTTHTPVETGHDKFPYGLVNTVLGDFTPLPELTRLAGEASLNMTLLALSTSGYVNGVALRHREVSEAMFPRAQDLRDHQLGPLVHLDGAELPQALQTGAPRLGGGVDAPRARRRGAGAQDLAAHFKAKRDLFAFVEKKTGPLLDENALPLGFARRFTPYKRPHLIFSDLDRLRRVTLQGPLQLVFAGKAHPRDEEGKRFILEVFEAIRALGGSVKIAFLPDHDMTVAKKLVAGVDVWLNTPEPPLEASGTSGMKAAHNGMLNFSVLDGW